MRPLTATTAERSRQLLLCLLAFGIACNSPTSIDRYPGIAVAGHVTNTADTPPSDVAMRVALWRGACSTGIPSMVGLTRTDDAGRYVVELDAPMRFEGCARITATPSGGGSPVTEIREGVLLVGSRPPTDTLWVDVQLGQPQ